MTLKTIYKQSVIYPGVILLVTSICYSVVTALMRKAPGLMAEVIVINLIAALLFGMVICTLALTVFLNNYRRVNASRVLSALSWFLLPGGFMCLVFGKAINEYLTVGTTREMVYALVANLPFMVGLWIGFRKFRALQRANLYC